MNNYLIGDTGLIGQNLLQHTSFTGTFNSTTIFNFDEIYVENSNVILSCLPATKWIVNKNKLNDLNNIHDIVNRLHKHKFSKLILISTIDVYLDSPLKVNEDFNPEIKKLHYGSNRLLFEKMVTELFNYDQLYIIRLPALFGKFLKKNIIFDLINDNCTSNINANSYYQWYYLENLYKDIKDITEKFDGGVFNLFTEPVYTKTIIDTFFKEIKTYKEEALVQYNWTTKYGKNGYIKSAEETLTDLGKFIHETRSK